MFVKEHSLDHLTFALALLAEFPGSRVHAVNGRIHAFRTRKTLADDEDFR